MELDSVTVLFGPAVVVIQPAAAVAGPSYFFPPTTPPPSWSDRYSSMQAASSGSLKSGCAALTSYTAREVHDWLLAERYAQFAPNNITEIILQNTGTVVAIRTRWSPTGGYPLLVQ